MELFDPAEQENEITKIRHGKPTSQALYERRWLGNPLEEGSFEKFYVIMRNTIWNMHGYVYPSKEYSMNKLEPGITYIL